MINSSKISKRLFIPIIIFTIFLSCESTTSSKINSLPISFVAYDVFNGDSLSIKPEKISVNGIEIQHTTLMGYSADLPLGDHNIKIESLEHNTLDTVFTISEKTRIVPFELKPKMISYFNPVLGEKWVFEYTKRNQYPNSGGNITTGEMTWLIIRDSLTTDSQEPVFVVNNHLEASRVSRNLAGETTDSTNFENTSSFNITLKNDGTVSYSHVSYLGNLTPETSQFYLINGQFRYPMYRSFPASRINDFDTVLEIEYGSPVLKSKIAPEIGFVDFYSYSMGNIKTSVSLDIISHSR